MMLSPELPVITLPAALPLALIDPTARGEHEISEICTERQITEATTVSAFRVGMLEHHITRLIDEYVAAGITEHEVGVAVPGQDVVTVSAIELCRAGPAVHRVVAGAAEQHVLAASTVEVVAEVRGDDDRGEAEYLSVEINHVEVAECILAE